MLLDSSQLWRRAAGSGARGLERLSFQLSLNWNPSGTPEEKANAISSMYTDASLRRKDLFLFLVISSTHTHICYLK